MHASNSKTRVGNAKPGVYFSNPGLVWRPPNPDTPPNPGIRVWRWAAEVTVV